MLFVPRSDWLSCVGGSQFVRFCLGFASCHVGVFYSSFWSPFHIKGLVVWCIWHQKFTKYLILTSLDVHNHSKILTFLRGLTCLTLCFNLLLVSCRSQRLSSSSRAFYQGIIYLGFHLNACVMPSQQIVPRCRPCVC